MIILTGSLAYMEEFKAEVIQENGAEQAGSHLRRFIKYSKCPSSKDLKSMALKSILQKANKKRKSEDDTLNERKFFSIKLKK